MSAAISSYHFKYRLSYWTLFSWSRRLQVKAHGLDIGDATLPPLAPDSDGLLLRALPLAIDVRPVTYVDHHGQTLLRYVLQRFPRYYISMTGLDFEAYKAKFSSKTRSTLARKVRKLAEHCGGSLRWESFRGPADLARFWQLAREVSAKTYQERLLDAGLPDDPAYRAQAERWAADDALRAFLLFDGERPVSYLFCPIHDGIVDYAFLGYDPAYGRFSVGTVLQWLALESLFAERRYRFFDFTEGESEHKRLFATDQLECAHVALLRPTLMHRLLVCSHHAFSRAVEGLGRWLDRHDLRNRVRRWMRDGRGDT